MEIEIKNEQTIIVSLNVIDQNKKSVNLNKMNSNELIDVLEEATNSFLEFQWKIESLLDKKCPSGFMIRDGEKIEWTQAINAMSLLNQ